MDKYILELNQNNGTNNFEELEQYARDNNVPIVKKDSLILILSLLDAISAKNILEIGCAIGYSSLQMVNNHSRHVDTFERNPEMIKLAQENIEKYQQSNQINIISEDALTYDINKLLPQYDFIFIDAAKAQYQKFFDKFSPRLSKNGIIVSDNILFHGCVENQEDLSKNLKHMVAKIDQYNQYLASSKDFHTYYLDCGDGLAITMRNSICK